MVCAALGEGAQSVLLRKGGIAEGRAGFAFRHESFFLFPTEFHEQREKLRQAPRHVPEEIPGQVTLRQFARVLATETVTSLAVAEALAPLHILRPEVVRERFAYGEAAGLQVAFVRIYRVEPAWSFPEEKRFGGCRSWIELHDEPPAHSLVPVLDDEENARRLALFRRLIAPPAETAAG